MTDIVTGTTVGAGAGCMSVAARVFAAKVSVEGTDDDDDDDDADDDDATFYSNFDSNDSDGDVKVIMVQQV